MTRAVRRRRRRLLAPPRPRSGASGSTRSSGCSGPAASLVVDEFGWDRLDETTLDWLYGQRRALAAAGHGEAPASHEELRRGVGGGASRPARVRRAARGLDARFDERAFELDAAPAPDSSAGVATEVLEQALIDAGAIQALGFPLRRRRSARLTRAINVTRIGDALQARNVTGALAEFDPITRVRHVGYLLRRLFVSTTLTSSTTTSTQRLTTSEAEGLWRNWKEQRDSRSRDQLVLAYAPMVRYIASRKVRELPAHCELDDLASSGLVALMEAIDRFDPTKGASFEQYAWTRVAGALVDELRKQDWASRSVRREGRRIERARDAYFARFGTMPAEAELAAELGHDRRRAADEPRGHRPLGRRFAERSGPRCGRLAADRGRRDDPGAATASSTRSRPCSAPTGTPPCAARSPASPTASVTFSPSCTCRSSPVPRSAGCSASASRASRRSWPASAAS